MLAVPVLAIIGGSPAQARPRTVAQALHAAYDEARSIPAVMATLRCILVTYRARTPKVGAGSPTELVQAVVVDPEVVRDLVHDGRLHLVCHLLWRLTHPTDLIAVDRDHVGQHAGVPLAALGEGDAVVEAKQSGLGWLILDDDSDVLHELDELLGYAVESFRHQLLELILR